MHAGTVGRGYLPFSGAPSWNPGNGRPFPPGWIGGVIPYVFDEAMPEEAREHAEQTMATWSEMTVLRFVRRTNEPDFIYFVERFQNCVWQPTCVRASGFAPNAEHGVGHGLGLQHEQQRRDRDRYVWVDQHGISPHFRGVWNPQSHHGADISPYNYQSVMHYGFISSKLNGRGGPRSLETIPPHMPVGEIRYTGPHGHATSITPGDVDTVARMVGLTPTSWTVSTNPLGLTVIVDDEEVTTPAVFDWTPGSEHTLSVPSGQTRPGSRYRFGRWSDDDAGATRTIVATSDTTLYEANFIAAQRTSTHVHPAGAGTVTISPNSSDGYYPLRSEITMSAEPTAGSGFRFLRWEINSDYLWQFLVTHEMHGVSANPARTYAMPGLEYTAVFTQEPVFRVESNVSPVTVEIDGRQYRTPVSLDARSLPQRATVALGREWIWADKGYRDRFRRWSDGGDETHAVSVSRTEDTVLELLVDTEHKLETTPVPNWREHSVVAEPQSDDGFYPEGTEVRLLASTTSQRAQFVGWNGDVAGQNPEARLVMNAGSLAEAIFVQSATELRSDVPVNVSLHWHGDSENGKMYWLRVPSKAREVEIRFSARTASPDAEAGLFVASRQQFPNWVAHENAQRVLRPGEIQTLTIPRPPDRWPTAYFILVRGAEGEADDQMLEGTLTASVKRYTTYAVAPSEESLPAVKVRAGGESTQVDLDALFVAADGGRLTFTAESSDDDVVAARTDGATLQVNPRRPGTANIKITATAPNGDEAERVLAITVLFDHGDSAESATLLSIGPPRPGTIGDASDVDVFRIDLLGSATLEVRTSGPTDTRGELRDGSGTRLATDDDSGPGRRNFLVRRALDAGTYYVTVTGELGEYAVMAQLADAQDHGETAAMSTLLTLHPEEELQRVSPNALLATPGRIAPTNADVDVFRLDVPQDDTDVVIRSSGTTDVHARLLDASLTELAADASEGNFRIEARVDAGVHYVVVQGTERGAYRVLAYGASASCPCAVASVTRDHGEDAEGSTIMPIGRPLVGAIADSTDTDVFRIDLQGRATLEVRTSGPTNTRGELLDGTGARLLSDDNSGPGGHNFLLRTALEAGIYYVPVTGKPGDYAVMASLGDARDHGGTGATATLLPLYAANDLRRVSPNALLATPGRIAPDDIDAFRLDVPDNDTDIAIRTAGGTDVFLRLVDASLNEVASDASAGNSRIEARLDAGIYYAFVIGRETGTYRVLAWQTSPKPCPCEASRSAR